jgi:uncharacterized protein (DUF2461 family)
VSRSFRPKCLISGDYCEQARAFADEYGLRPQEIDGVLALAGTVARQRAQKKSGSPTATVLPADAFAFLSDLRANNTSEWMAANRARYEGSLREPFRELMQAVADRFIVDLDPELNTRIKTGDVLASIRKRFPNDEGAYHSYYWGAFSRGRKQEDVQLYVRIDWDSFRVGIALGSAAKEKLDQLRKAAKDRPWSRPVKHNPLSEST